MNSEKLRGMTYISLIGAVMCIIAPISIKLPISAVPISFATLIVYFSSAVIGAKKGTAALILYYLIGAAGMPVFSGYMGGIQVFVGPTGGYLTGYIFCALFTGFFAEKFENNIYMYGVGMIIGTIIMYIMGSVWYSYIGNIDFRTAILTSVLPFIPGDIVKIIIASMAGYRAKKVYRQAA